MFLSEIPFLSSTILKIETILGFILPVGFVGILRSGILFYVFRVNSQWTILGAVNMGNVTNPSHNPPSRSCGERSVVTERGHLTTDEGRHHLTDREQ